MNFSLSYWLDIAETRGVRLLTILILAIVVVRIWKAFTNRMVEISKAHTRVGQMREQQTRTVAGILYSTGVTIVLAFAVLTALPEFGFNVTPVEAVAAVASLAFGFGAQPLATDWINRLPIAIWA